MIEKNNQFVLDRFDHDKYDLVREQDLSYDRAMMSDATSSDDMSLTHGRNRYVIISIVIFLCFIGIWILYVWPALFSEWWATDDYYSLQFKHIGLVHFIAIAKDNFRFGRPLGIPLFLANILLIRSPFPLFSSGALLRIIQGGAHSANALLIGFLLFKATGKKTTLLTPLPFLVWPLGGDATYWIAAAAYPLSGFFSLIGILLCFKQGIWRWAGISLLACSVLINQSGCLLGLIALWIFIVLRLFSRSDWRQVLRPWAYVVLGYSTGLLFLTLGTPLLHTDRITSTALFSFSSSWMFFRFSLLHLLNESGTSYPLWLRGVQIALPIYACITVMAHSFARNARDHRSWKQNLITVSAFVVLLVLPYAPLYILGINWLAGRVMLPATLLYSAALCLLLQSNIFPRTQTIVVVVSILTLLAGYFPTSRSYAEAHVINYQKDMERLRLLEETAQAANTRFLVVGDITKNGLLNNPYQFPFPLLGDSLISAFRSAGYLQLFVESRSESLSVLREKPVYLACRTYCDQPALKTRITILNKPFRVLCYCTGNNGAPALP